MNLPDDVYGPIARSESQAHLFNVGCGEDLTIHELAELIRDIVGLKGRLTFDASKPYGTLRKLLDVSRMKEFGWHADIPLREGLAAAHSSKLFDNVTLPILRSRNGYAIQEV